MSRLKTMIKSLPVVGQIALLLKDLACCLMNALVCCCKGWHVQLAWACQGNWWRIPRTTHFEHPLGIVIHGDTRLGENCDIKHNVTIGRREGSHDTDRRCPVLGDNVIVGAGAIILGPVTIGDNARIGAGAIVLKDVPANTLYVSKFEPAFVPLQG